MAHATLLSGLWIDNQHRYRTLVTSDRFTLTGAFARAGWRTVGWEPGVTRAWPEGAFYGYDRIVDSRGMGYRGPQFGWAPMPDQFTLDDLGRAELAPGHAPVMAVVPLVSSHVPWAPLPRAVPWEQVGDGSVFDGMPAAADQPAQVWADPSRIKAAYSSSIVYSLDTLVGFVQRYGGDDTVLVMLGDHQPAQVVTGPDAEPRRPRHGRGSRPRGARPHLGVEVEHGPAPGARRARVADERVQGPVPRRLRRPRPVVEVEQTDVAAERPHQRGERERDGGGRHGAGQQAGGGYREHDALGRGDHLAGAARRELAAQPRHDPAGGGERVAQQAGRVHPRDPAGSRAAR